MKAASKLAVVMLVLGVSACAQELEKGAWELGLWTAGGHSVPGGTGDTGVWNAGIRAGKVLTEEHGSGFVRGNLEYAVDVIPVSLLMFSRQTSYAAGFDPLILKWNFTSGRKVVPYLEIGGGVLVSTDDLPPGSSNVNFTPQASFGVQIFTHSKRAVSVAAKYVHISNAGLATPNPGINTVQFSFGYHWFK